MLVYFITSCLTTKTFNLTEKILRSFTLWTSHKGLLKLLPPPSKLNVRKRYSTQLYSKQKHPIPYLEPLKYTQCETRDDNSRSNTKLSGSRFESFANLGANNFPDVTGRSYTISRFSRNETAFPHPTLLHSERKVALWIIAGASIRVFTWKLVTGWSWYTSAIPRSPSTLFIMRLSYLRTGPGFITRVHLSFHWTTPRPLARKCWRARRGLRRKNLFGVGCQLTRRENCSLFQISSLFLRHF